MPTHLWRSIKESSRPISKASNHYRASLEFLLRTLPLQRIKLAQCACICRTRINDFRMRFTTIFAQRAAEAGPRIHCRSAKPSKIRSEAQHQYTPCRVRMVESGSPQERLSHSRVQVAGQRAKRMRQSAVHSSPPLTKLSPRVRMIFENETSLRFSASRSWDDEMTLNIRKTMYGTELRRFKLPAYAARGKDDLDIGQDSLGCANLVLKRDPHAPTLNRRDRQPPIPPRTAPTCRPAQAQLELCASNEQLPRSVLQLFLIVLARIVILASLEILISIERYSGIPSTTERRYSSAAARPMVDTAAPGLVRRGDVSGMAEHVNSYAEISVEQGLSALQTTGGRKTTSHG